MRSSLKVAAGQHPCTERRRPTDEELLRQVHETYRASVYAATLRVVVDRDVAEDVTQEVFLHVWRNFSTLDLDREDLQGLLVTIARRRGIDFVRSQESRRRREAHVTGLLFNGQLRGTHDDIADDIVTRDSIARSTHVVHQAIGDLPPLERHAIDLAYFGGCTLREVATVTGSPEGTTKSRVRRALRRMERNPNLQLVRET